MPVRIGMPEPTSGDPQYNQRCIPEYLVALQDAGAQVQLLALRADAGALAQQLASCDAFLLPGSPADVDPLHFGEARGEYTAEADMARETCDGEVLQHAARLGKPVLGICYGVQRTNVWLGGTLVQNLTPLPVNHEAGSSVAVAHNVLVAGQSLLAGLLTQSEAPALQAYRQLPVNSSHHQAVSLPGQGLAVVARCAQDGVVEALEGRIGQAAFLGVQWHPERSTAMSAASRALFRWLVFEAEDHRAGEGGVAD